MGVDKYYKSGLYYYYFLSFSGELVVKYLPTHPWRDQKFSLLMI